MLGIAVLVLVGSGIRLYRSAQGLDPLPSFDYFASDSVFHERSRRLLVPDTAGRSYDRPATETLRPASINVNTASKQDLMLLPGIGEKYAERIILHREDNGPYEKVEDLEKVKGIGPKTVEKLRKYVTVKSDTTR